MENLESIIISNNSRVSFKLKYSFSYIKIKRIIVDSLLGSEPNRWFLLLNSFNLVFNYSDRRGSKKEIKMNLMIHISPYHRQPVIEFTNLMIPEENVKNITSLSNYYTDLMVYIEPVNKSMDNIQITLLYESSPGVMKLND